MGVQFFITGGKVMRLAKRIVKVAGIITRNRGFKAPLEHRGINLLNGEKVSCLGGFYYLQCGKPHILSSAARIFANGPAVCFSRRNPTTAPGSILVPRASGAEKLSRCKEGLARVFAVMVQIFLGAGAVAVQIC